MMIASTTPHTHAEIRASFSELWSALKHRIIGQENLIKQLLIALLADGHVLVEGGPGLAKTSAIKTLAQLIHASFQRIQFTPDVLPADLTGTDIYRAHDGTFQFQAGPLFHHLILADEINRAPAKVQSALLEAMGERQVTVGQHTYQLPSLFLVMATQNPLEHEGTYPLPEAQLDRFLLNVVIQFPNADQERLILRVHREAALPTPAAVMTPDHLLQARQALTHLHLSPLLEEYLIQCIMSTRKPELYHPQLAEWIQSGLSSRATIGWEKAARAHAWLHQRDFVAPEDVHGVMKEIFRHRLILRDSALAQGMTPDQVVDFIVDTVPLP